jgi:hypothetical protein
MSHGYSIDTEKPDKLVHLVQTAAEDFYVATSPGRWLVDNVPSRSLIPSLQISNKG